MSESVLVIIKPDGITRNLVGHILAKFAESNLEMVAMKSVQVDKKLAEAHYMHIKGQPFFKGVIDYLLGKFHSKKNVLAVVYHGEKAIKVCREIAGATNPEEASPKTIRGMFGRITTKGVYENVVHVSSTKKDAAREIKMWFSPNEVQKEIFPIKIIKQEIEQKVWK